MSTPLKKKQVWLRPDQAELVVSCLEYVRLKLNQDLASGAHSKVAGPFTYNRIGEVLDLLKEPE